MVLPEEDARRKEIQDIVKSYLDASFSFKQGSGITTFNGGLLQSPIYKKGSAGWAIDDQGNAEFNDGTFRGALTAATIDIGGADATSFHVDVDGNTWSGAATFAAAPFKVSNAGALTASSVTITGGTIGGSTTVGIANVNIAARGWMQTSVFSVTDADTVAWAAGTFTSADGTAYSIGGGNTGNMAAATYIYLDTAVSTTAYQTTTTAANAVGAGKVLIAKAQNGTGEATFQVFGGIGGQNIDAASIVANSITANELSTSITYAGTIIIDTAGNIRSGATAYLTGTGWFIGNVSGTAKLSIGNPAGRYLAWDGSDLIINGYVQTNIGTFGGDGSDGALSITSGTTSIDLGGVKTFIKNYTSISIMGTGALAFTNPHAEGTQIIFKSQGNVTITSSATRAIDLRGLGCTGGAGGSGSDNADGSVGTDSSKIIDSSAHYGGAGGPGGLGGTGGLQITQASGIYSNLAVNVSAMKMTLLIPGGGGGGGEAGAADGGTRGNGGAGGRGAGCMVIECKGAYNVTGTIDLSGTDGTAGADGGPTNGAGGGGGGGGAGGMFLAMYNTLTADSGTYTVAGGAGGAAGVKVTGQAGSGGGGAGTTEAAGTDGTSAGGGTGPGGAGAAGIAIRMLNTAFA